MSSSRKQTKSSTELEADIDGREYINASMMSLFASTANFSQTADTTVTVNVPSPERIASLERLQAMTQLFKHSDETQSSQPAAPTVSPRK